VEIAVEVASVVMVLLLLLGVHPVRLELEEGALKEEEEEEKKEEGVLFLVETGNKRDKRTTTGCHPPHPPHQPLPHPLQRRAATRAVKWLTTSF
jgi:hypothetical protein